MELFFTLQVVSGIVYYCCHK